MEGNKEFGAPGVGLAAFWLLMFFGGIVLAIATWQPLWLFLTALFTPASFSALKTINHTMASGGKEQPTLSRVVNSIDSAGRAAGKAASRASAGLDTFLTTWLTIAGVAAAITGVAVFGWQAFQYLKRAVWHPLSLNDGLAYAGLKWATHPETWLGLHEIFGGIPLSLALVLFGIFWSMFVVAASDWR